MRPVEGLRVDHWLVVCLWGIHSYFAVAVGSHIAPACFSDQ